VHIREDGIETKRNEGINGDQAKRAGRKLAMSNSNSSRLDYVEMKKSISNVMSSRDMDG
jgi:hypothetical protein